ncbi:carbohydrate kinase, thermoresistant glucokinase family [Paracidovorax avenae ATCC 19860]|uniref:Gluconokinase n=1 Tax=Paracidovorax avenae (strain ATCC 19860 / DSM 7227 / CCUG 15838 / JCM 20985 / LMG 2117 / NCPPB 1011) TaxID=643561 RepID=F0QDD0_PARA1|nr:gluconokinase [Paracidovorax avenae]ADX46375.1 carbohydrate kinase, thermoresistant glucokinase family [Paracidovorax avenae ATCC 19860]
MNSQDSAIQSRPLPAVVVMGVSGCGKSSVAAEVAALLGWALHEGDAYHSPESVAKMRAGQPLTDEDRAGWLDRLAQLLAHAVRPSDGAGQGGIVLTCSALRRRYRDHLRAAAPGLRFAFLELDYDEALARVSHRPGHFFSPTLVANQFATLESPRGEAGVLALDATLPIHDLGAAIAHWMHGDGGADAAAPSPHAPGAPSAPAPSGDTA